MSVGLLKRVPLKGSVEVFVIRAERKGLNVLNRVWGSIKNIKV